MDTIQDMKKIFEDVFKVEFDNFDTGISPADVEAWDSTAHVSLVLAIEKHFSVEFTPAELGKLYNVGAISDIIEKRMRT